MHTCVAPLPHFKSPPALEQDDGQAEEAEPPIRGHRRQAERKDPPQTPHTHLRRLHSGQHPA